MPRVGDSVHELFRRAVKLRKSEQLEGAKECLQHIIKERPRYIPALNEMGKILSREGDYNKATHFFRRILNLKPGDPYALTELGVIYCKQDNIRRAISFFNQALEKEPDFAYAMSELGFIFYKQGNYRKAIELFLKSLKIEPDNVRVLSHLGLTYNQQGDITKANSCFRQLAERLKDSRQQLRKSEEEIKRKDAQLIASGRVTTANAMATCFAHQINNPLQIIQTVIFNLMEEPQIEEADLRENLTKIQHHADRINELVNHLNKLVKDEAEDSDFININEVIISAFGLFEGQLSSREIQVNLNNIEDRRSAPIVYGNSIKLEQVFINLIANARDALESMVKPEITVQTVVIPEKRIRIFFSDNGQGISEEDLARIFDSLFTTKPKGTGLGLWLCYSIIHQMNGTIRVESKLGKGTTFIITLPYKGGNRGKS
jgi:signal transduction histidine kinase